MIVCLTLLVYPHKLQASIHSYLIVDSIRKYIPHTKLSKPWESQGPSPLINMAPMVLRSGAWTTCTCRCQIVQQAQLSTLDENVTSQWKGNWKNHYDIYKQETSKCNVQAPQPNSHPWQNSKSELNSKNWNEPRHTERQEWHEQSTLCSSTAILAITKTANRAYILLHH